MASEGQGQNITGTTANDTLEGGLNDDTIRGEGGADSIVGGDGNDLVHGDGNMLVNGSLEAGITNANWGVKGIEGWTSAGGSSEVWATGHSGVASADGDNHVEIDSYSSRSDFLYQEVQTTAGEVYEVSFQLRARPGSGVNDSLEFYFNGEKISASIPPSTDEWTTFNFQVTGTGGMDRVEFREAEGQSDSYGPLLDNIKMVTVSDDIIRGNGGMDTLHGEAGNDSVTGGTGNDTLTGETGNDLLAGGGASSEWRLVDGEWVYDPDQLRSQDNPDPYYVADGADDLLIGGSGKDVLLGNAGNDTLIGGTGRDRLYGHKGDDEAYGGAGADKLFMGKGNDYAEGGSGADTIGGGLGDDLLYGDNVAVNLLSGVPDGAKTFAELSNQSAWEDASVDGLPGLSQEVQTSAGETYTFSFDLAANLPAGKAAGAVEVLWNDEVIGTYETSSGAFESHTVSFIGDGQPGTITIRNLPDENASAPEGPEIDTSGPIFSYQKDMVIGGETVEVPAFAPGQAKLFQVISGKLKVFDPVESSYVDAGPDTGLKVNAIGFNVEDDMIYGLARQAGTDTHGNDVAKNDLVMMDADGNAHRIGATNANDYVGDFDADGNLWTFHTSLDRMTRIDVDNLDADGNPMIEHFYLPKNFMTGRMYDIAYNAEENTFYGVEPPSADGKPGYVHKIDLTDFQPGSTPEVTTIPISGTLFDGVMKEGMAKGAYGAVFLDGDGNLYAGLNRGDHDLGGDAGASGAIYQIKIDEVAGHAYAEFKAESETTGSNDGAVDPRSVNPFAEVDQTATVQIKAPELQMNLGGNDVMMGGAGLDTMSGGGGDDTLSGGADDDVMMGDVGNDKLMGGQGNDEMSGGLGDDFLIGGQGENTMDGGAGADRLKGGIHDDDMSGGAGNDRLWAGSGDDKLSGGSGDDQLVASAGNDTVDGGSGQDHVMGNGGDDVLSGGGGKDLVQGGFGNDVMDGGAGVDKVVGGAGSDIISGGGGRDHLWGGEWSGDGESDTFAYSKGGDTDTIHDFETEHDRIDLSEYGLSFEDIQSRMIDRGWATEINLEGVDKSGAGDKLMLKNVKPEDLDDTNFIT